MCMIQWPHLYPFVDASVVLSASHSPNSSASLVSLLQRTHHSSVSIHSQHTTCIFTLVKLLFWLILFPAQPINFTLFGSNVIGKFLFLFKHFSLSLSFCSASKFALAPASWTSKPLTVLSYSSCLLCKCSIETSSCLQPTCVLSCKLMIC